VLLIGCTQEVSFGVLSDVHGQCDTAVELAEQFGDVAGIIVAGDITGESSEDIERCLNMLTQFNVPIYAIPGNHDIEWNVPDDVVDLSETRYVDLNGVDIIGNPYGDDFTFANKATNKEIEEIKKYEANDPVLLVSHQPPKNGCVDEVYSGEAVGSEVLRDAMQDIKFSVSGHIHEAGGRACTKEGLVVEENILSDELLLNPGAVTQWKYLDGTVSNKAAVITIKGAKAKYRIVELI
jgi:Icc-related predicted phosphoesterase